MRARLHVPLSWRQLLKRTFGGTWDDNVLDLAAQQPYGRNPGERVAGEKKFVGAKAARLYEEKRAKGEIPIKPIPDTVNCDIDRGTAIDRHPPTVSELVIGTIALAPAALLAAKKVRDEMKKSA